MHRYFQFSGCGFDQKVVWHCTQLLTSWTFYAALAATANIGGILATITATIGGFVGGIVGGYFSFSMICAGLIGIAFGMTSVATSYSSYVYYQTKTVSTFH